MFVRIDSPIDELHSGWVIEKINDTLENDVRGGGNRVRVFHRRYLLGGGRWGGELNEKK